MRLAVDVVVNNAGMGPVPSTVIDADPEDVKRVLDVNLFGVWNGVSVFGKRFIAQGTSAANQVRSSQRVEEIKKAFERYAPRYDGDDEFDVRTLGLKRHWYPDVRRRSLSEVRP